jgi:hypothetical protein
MLLQFRFDASSFLSHYLFTSEFICSFVLCTRLTCFHSASVYASKQNRSHAAFIYACSASLVAQAACAKLIALSCVVSLQQHIHIHHPGTQSSFSAFDHFVLLPSDSSGHGGTGATMGRCLQPEGHGLRRCRYLRNIYICSHEAWEAFRSQALQLLALNFIFFQRQLEFSSEHDFEDVCLETDGQ